MPPVKETAKPSQPSQTPGEVPPLRQPTHELEAARAHRLWWERIGKHQVKEK